MRLLACVVMLAVAGTVLAGPIGFSYSVFPVFRDDRMDATGRVYTQGPWGVQYIPANIAPPTGATGEVREANGIIPLLSMPTDAFLLGKAGSGSGIFTTVLQVTEWVQPYNEQRVEFAAYGEVRFADNDITRGILYLEFTGAGVKRFKSANNAYDLQMFSSVADGMTRIDALYTVTPLDGSAPVVETPEPATIVSAAFGLVGVAGVAMRRRRRERAQRVEQFATLAQIDEK